MDKIALTLWLAATIVWPVQHLLARNSNSYVQLMECTHGTCCTQLSDKCHDMGKCPTGTLKLATVKANKKCTDGQARIAAVFSDNGSDCENIINSVSFGCEGGMTRQLHFCVNSQDNAATVIRSFSSWITTNCHNDCEIEEIDSSEFDAEQFLVSRGGDLENFKTIMCALNYEDLLMDQTQLLMPTTTAVTEETTIRTVTEPLEDQETANDTQAQDNSVNLCLRIDNCSEDVFYSHTGYNGDCQLPHFSVCDPSNQTSTGDLCETYDTVTTSFIEAHETETDDIICPYYNNLTMIYNINENKIGCTGLQELHKTRCNVYNTTCYCSTNLDRCEEISSGDGSGSSGSSSSSDNSLSPFTEERNDSFCTCFKRCGCGDGDVRLIGENDRVANRQGRVEICFNDTWGTMCDNGWTAAEAHVVCRQLGITLIQEDPIVYYNASIGGLVDPPRPIFLDKVSCTGNESKLVDCNLTSQNDCDHSEDVGVECYVVRLSIIDSEEIPESVLEPENGVQSLSFKVLLNTTQRLDSEYNLTLGRELNLTARQQGDATPDEDYYIQPTSQSFLVGDGTGTSITFNVNITSDDLVELEENIVLTVIRRPIERTSFPNPTVRIRIRDSDVANLSIVGPEVVNVAASNFISIPLNVSLSTVTESGILRLGSTFKIDISVTDAGAGCFHPIPFVTFNIESFDGNTASKVGFVTCHGNGMQQDVKIQLVTTKLPPNIHPIRSEVITTIMYQTVTQDEGTTTATQGEGTTTATQGEGTTTATQGEGTTTATQGEGTTTATQGDGTTTATQGEGTTTATQGEGTTTATQGEGTTTATQGEGTTTATQDEGTTAAVTNDEAITSLNLLSQFGRRLSNVEASSFLLEYDRLALTYDEGFHDISKGISLQVVDINSTEPDPVANNILNNSITLPFQIINATEAVRFISLFFDSEKLPQAFPATLDGYNGSIVGSPIITAALACNESSYCDTSSHQLPEDSLITIYLEHKELQNQEQICVFWDFVRLPNNSITGEWNTSGCQLNYENSSSTIAVCECNHLTHFAILLSPVEIPPDHAFALQTIGYVGISISLFALAVTALVFICFKSLWSMRNFIHINLCLSLMASYLVFLFGIDKTSNEAVCSFIGVLLHYLFLVSFMWMLMEGVVLYVVLVKVFISEYSKKVYVLIFAVVSYGIPLLYVLVISVPIGFLLNGMNHYYYVQEDETVSACWLRYDTHFIWSFNVPVIIIIMINFGLFIMALVILQRQRKKSVKKQNKRHSISQWIKSVVSLTVIMGLTWIIGVLIFHESLLPLAYIFTIAVALQGLAIFVMLVLLSKQVRLVFIRWLRDRVNGSSFLSSHFGDKMNTLMQSRSRKDTNSSVKNQSNVHMGYQLGTFGTSVSTAEVYENPTYADVSSSLKSKNKDSIKLGNGSESLKPPKAVDFKSPVCAEKENDHDDQKESKRPSVNVGQTSETAFDDSLSLDEDSSGEDLEDMVVSSITVHVT